MPAKKLLITGANRGVGFHIAKYFAGEGYFVRAMNKTKAEVPWLHEVPCDLSDTAQLEAQVGQLLATDQGYEVVVLNAAVRRLQTFEQMGTSDWFESVNVNLNAVFLLLKYLLPALKAKKATVVIIGSHAGSHYFEGGAAYCATKAALKALTEVFIMETRQYGIRATLLSPGAIRNRDITHNDLKIQPENLAQFVYTLCQMPENMLFGEIEVRPGQAVQPPTTGIARLQYL